MTSDMIEKWVETMTDICDKNFPQKFLNVTIHYVGGHWRVMIESPHVRASEVNITAALASARSQVDAIIKQQQDLSRTLGLEAAE